MRKRTLVAVLGLVGLGAYRARRQLIARWLRLPPPQYDVAVERNLPVLMPDGVTLMATHYRPQAAGSFPTVLIRSPYGRGAEAGVWGRRLDLIATPFAERGYHVIIQGTRGRFDSGGHFDPLVNEATDGRATLEWTARQPWFNGALGMWGPSYLGYVQWAVAADAPAYLKALAPSFITSRGYALAYPADAFAMDLALRWIWSLDAMEQPLWKFILRALRQERDLAPAFQHVPLREAEALVVGRPVAFYRDWLSHPQPDDPYWERSDHSRHMAQVTVPLHLLGGWYDVFLRGMLADYAALRAAGHTPYLTIGPWTHIDAAAGWASLREGMIWLDVHLKGERSRLRPQPVQIYVMGANEWREMADWPPPARETRYFLHAYGRLSTTGPEADSPPGHYRYDPADPTPAVGGPLLSRQAGPKDNRALEGRPDVLCYTTPSLVTDVEVIGPVRLELYVRSSLAHTDFFGRLCDVHPDGRSINICDGLFRIEPGKGERQPDGSLRIEIDLWATAQRFLRGHRIRLQVSSGAHPRWNRNLGTGESVGAGTRMAIAEQTIYHDSEHPSALVLPVATLP
jgi:hypothetical protein